MKQCKNCGGQLVFDIMKQAMRCRSCHEVFPVDPNDDDGKTAKEDRYLETNTYICPVCGGSITSVSEEVASGFCTYCGNNVTFEGRVDKVRRPGYILPFTCTKKKAKKAYKEFIDKQFFAPDDLKDETKIDSFRGIYMPYWDFTVHQTGQVNREYTSSTRVGDYVNTHYKRMTWNIDEYRNHILHDASEKFNDEIGLYVTPFEMQYVKNFDTDYMEGFYADTADVESSACEKVAFEIADRQTEGIIDAASAGDIRNDHNKDGWSNTTDHVNLLMMPLWFMSYKNGNRVSYAVMNGQTGKLYADIPVDPKKYLVSVAALTVILTVLLGIFLTPIPSSSLAATVVVQMVALFCMLGATNRIIEKDGLSEKKRTRFAGSGKKHHFFDKYGGKLMSVFIFVLIFGSSIIIPVFGGVAVFFMALFADVEITGGLPMAIGFTCGVISLVVTCLLLSKSGKLRQGNNGHFVFPGYLCTMVCIILCVGVLLVNPAHDLWYYVPMAVSILMLIVSMLSMIRLSNMRASQMIPHFKTHTGGFDTVYDEE